MPNMEESRSEESRLERRGPRATHSGKSPENVGKMGPPDVHDQVAELTQRLRRLEGFMLGGESENEALRMDVDALDQVQRQLQTDLHSYLVIQSMGLDCSDVPLHRFVPMRVYLSDVDKVDADLISAAVDKFVNTFGFCVSDDFPAETGSWSKKWFVKTKDAVTQPEVTERLEKIERSLEIQGLHKPQAEVDKTEAEAAAMLIKAIDNVPNAAIQIGSLLLVKTTSDDGKNSLQVCTLTPTELIHLEKNQKLLTSPQTILHKLTALCADEVKALPDA